MGRETRIGLLTFAVLSVGVTFNLFFMQGRRVQTTVETAAILRPDDLRAAPVADTAAPAAQDPAMLDGALTVTPPQPAVRPLPVAVAPPASISRAVVTRCNFTPCGGASDTGPEIKVVSAPARASASAMA